MTRVTGNQGGEELTAVYDPHMNSVDRGRIRAAIAKAVQIYPQAVADTIVRELHSWEAQSLPLGKKMDRLIEAILSAPYPPVKP